MTLLTWWLLQAPSGKQDGGGGEPIGDLTLDEFIAKYTGQEVDAEDGWGWAGECVSLVQRYLHDCFNIPVKARGDAIDWQYTIEAEGIGYRVQTPVKGDIPVWDERIGVPEGHVSIYLGNGKHFQQNWGGNRTAHIANMPSTPVVCYLRIKGGQ